MNSAEHNILAINGGSSSIKFALFAADPSLYMKSKGRIERIGTPYCLFSVQGNDLVNFKSGLLGVSETSSDMRKLLLRECEDSRAADAIAIFCYQIKKWVDAFAATPGGLDTLVFAGGIGENIPNIRARICADFEFLGIELDSMRNQHSEHVISADATRVRVRVMRTNVELVIARSVCRILELDVGEARIES